MRLLLEDNSRPGMVKIAKKKNNMHYVYDPQTQDVHFIHDEFMPVPLSGKARKVRVKRRKANKGKRQKLRQDGRETNLLKRIAKRGRKQDSKFQPDSSIDTPDSGSQTQPQNFAPSSGGGGGGGNPISPGGEDYSQPIDNSQPDTVQLQPDDQGGGEEADPSTYEQMPDDDYGSEDSSDPYNGAMNDYYGYSGLSAGGIWGAAFNAVKGAAKGVINQAKTNPTINPAAAQMQSQIDALQKQLDAANSSNMTKQLITGAVSAGIGAAAGYFIAKRK